MEIYDIKGYWNSDFSDKYIKNQTWYGQIRVDKDGWFEGVVLDKGSSNNENIFICGIFYPGLVFELYKLAPTCDQLVYHSLYDQGGYEGVFEEISSYSFKPAGRARICAREIKGTEEELSNGLEYLNGLIEANKRDRFDEACLSFYKGAYEQRKDLSKIVLGSSIGMCYPIEGLNISTDKRLKFENKR